MGVFASRAYGSSNERDTINVIHNGLILAVIIGLAYTFLIFILGNKFIESFKLSKQASIYALEYIFYRGFGIILFIVNPVISQAFIAIGDPLIPFKINTLGAITNINLDPIIIFGFGSLAVWV